MDSTIDNSLAPLVGVLATIIAIALYVWLALALSAMFRKMGEEPWKAWVPFLNYATVLAWGGFSPWLVLLVLIPGVGVVIVAVLLVISAHRINPGFGYGASMTVLAALLFVVWASILGFGPTPWRGARPAMAPPPVPRPPLPTMPAAHAAATGAYPAPPSFPAVLGQAATSSPAAPRSFLPPSPSPYPTDAARAQPVAPGPSFPAEALPGAGSSARSPEPVSWAPPTPPAASPATPPSAVEPDVASWPSEIDDVSAVSPSPFPPSAATPSPARPATASGSAAESGLISFVPGRGEDDAAPSSPVTRFPATAPIDTSAAAPHAGAARDDDAFPEPSAFPELSGEVSAVVGSPAAGAPLSARSSVAAQQRAEAAASGAPGDADETVMVRRRRIAWQLVPAAASPVPLTAEVVILGRRPAPDPAFPHAQLVSVHDEARTVSKTHARLELRGEKWLVTDLGSTNGVLLRTLMGEEMEIEPGTELDAGERFFLGDEEFHLQHD